MINKIHIVGASGAGTSTLGQALEREYGYKWLDTDDYFWLPTDPPFEHKRPVEERIALMAEDIEKHPKCVISGSLCGWGDVFLPQFDMVIYVDTPTDVRIERLHKREYQRFGARIYEGGDMYDNHNAFIQWAANYDTAGFEQRSRAEHEEWFKLLSCPLIRINGAIPAREQLPVLYDKMQMWLSLQSAPDEIWDVYDSKRNPTGRIHRRGDPMPPGDYHIVVHVWMLNSNGEFLITKRAPNRGYPNMWECVGGSAITRDDSITAAIREVKEETGLTLSPETGECLFSITRVDNFCDIWLFRQDFDINDVILQENETIDAMYATPDYIQQMIDNGKFLAFSYIDKLFELAKDTKE